MYVGECWSPAARSAERTAMIISAAGTVVLHRRYIQYRQLCYATCYTTCHNEERSESGMVFDSRLGVDIYMPDY